MILLQILSTIFRASAFVIFHPLPSRIGKFCNTAIWESSYVCQRIENTYNFAILIALYCYSEFFTNILSLILYSNPYHLASMLLLVNLNWHWGVNSPPRPNPTIVLPAPAAGGSTNSIARLNPADIKYALVNGTQVWEYSFCRTW